MNILWKYKWHLKGPTLVNSIRTEFFEKNSENAYSPEMWKRGKRIIWKNKSFHWFRTVTAALVTEGTPIDDIWIDYSLERLHSASSSTMSKTIKCLHANSFWSCTFLGIHADPFYCSALHPTWPAARHPTWPAALHPTWPAALHPTWPAALHPTWPAALHPTWPAALHPTWPAAGATC
jgi:hypothetical protein